jgi:hypothetical protein
MKKTILTFIALGAVYLVQAQTPTQPPTAGMETWASDPTFREPKDPVGWVSTNALASPLLTFPNPNPNPTSVTQDSVTPFSGKYSAKITSVKMTTNPAYPSVPDTVGNLLLGSIKASAPFLISGIPYTDKPVSFSFQYKYAPVGPDAAGVFVQLSKWSTVAPAGRIIIASGVAPLPATSTYSPISFSLNYLNTTTFPDTLQIAYSSSYVRANARPGSVLEVDGLAFTGISGIQEYKNTVRFSAYPNPANAEINLLTDSKEVSLVSICDITGRQIDAIKVISDHTVLNTGSYTNGIYIYSAMNAKGEIIARGKFNVIK